MCLEKHCYLLNAGVPKDKLKIRNRELFNDGVKIELPRKNAEPNQHSDCLLSLNNLQINAKTLIT